MGSPPEPASIDPPFDVLEPAFLRGPVVFSSPHSGCCYPPSFLAQTRLDALTLRRSEDAFVDELFASAVPAGAPLLRARFPRAFLDVNREPYELDPRMFDGRVPSYANTRSLRVAGGLGTIARIVGDAQEIYERRLPIGEALLRIETFYKPYHQTLRRLLLRTRARFGAAILVDCHSMPSRASMREDRPRADIVLGDRYGASCAPALTDLVESTLRRLGYAVARNRPYAGGYITEHYGNPPAGLHAIQIELNRALYMDELRHTKTDGFAAVEADLARLVAVVVETEITELSLPTQTAAE